MLPDNLRDWALRQSVFFVASAPLRGRHINISPKGVPESSLAVLNSSQVAYIDSVGTGCETICHVRENGRVTMLFCSFDKLPRTMRLFCIGSVVEFNEPEYGVWLKRMGDKNLVAARAIIVLNIFKVCTHRHPTAIRCDTRAHLQQTLRLTFSLGQVQLSCGFGVPLLGLDPGATLHDPKPCFLTRTRLQEFGQYTVDRGQLRDYQKRHNSESLDGLPGLYSALRDSGKSIWWAKCKNWYSRNQHTIEHVQRGIILGLLLVLALQPW